MASSRLSFRSEAPRQAACRPPITSPDKSLRILLIDEFPERAALLEEALTASRHEVMARFSSGPDLREQVVRVQPDVIIVDVDSPSHDLTMEVKISKTGNKTYEKQLTSAITAVRDLFQCQPP